MSYPTEITATKMRRRLSHGGVFWGLCGRRKAAGYLSPPSQPPAPLTIAERRFGGSPSAVWQVRAVSELNGGSSATIAI